MEFIANVFVVSTIVGNVLAIMALVGSLRPGSRHLRILSWANLSTKIGAGLVLMLMILGPAGSLLPVFVLAAWLPLFLGYIARIRL